ncbi:MAG: DUF2510 domain-containing protein [Candidatus Sericytochromatia bacterium]
MSTTAFAGVSASVAHRLCGSCVGYLSWRRPPPTQGGASSVVSGALNFLVWILILIVIVAAVIAIVRTFARPGGATVVEQPVVHQVPPATGGLSPGWYPDQNDPGLMRYYDGRVWTAQTQPRA